MSNQHPKPTDSELEILQILWEYGASTVRFVNEKQNEKSEKETGYTTTLKILQIMFEKGLVSRDEANRTHIYSAGVTEKETQNVLLDKFLDATFKGSAMDMVMQALGNKKTSKKEIDEIRKFLDKLEGGEL